MTGDGMCESWLVFMLERREVRFVSWFVFMLVRCVVTLVSLLVFIGVGVCRGDDGGVSTIVVLSSSGSRSVCPSSSGSSASSSMSGLRVRSFLASRREVESS